MTNAIIRRAFLLCLILCLLASCTPTAEATSPPPPTPDATAPPAATPTTRPTVIPTATTQPLPRLPENFDPAAFLTSEALEVIPLPREDMTRRTGEGSYVIIYPLQKNEESGAYQYDTAHDITLLKVPSGILLGTGDQYALRQKTTEDQRGVLELQAAVLPHLVGGQPFLGIVILSAGVRDLSSDEYLLDTLFVEEPEEDIIANATYFGGRDTIYPNKLANILIAISYIAEYQDENGPLQAQDGYSFNNMIRLRGGDTLRYADGANNLWAAGVCAVASLTSASLYDLSQALDVDYTDSLTAIIRTQYQHQIAEPYAACPYIPVDVDTVVAVLPDLSADLVWQMPPEPAETYLTFDAAVIANEIPFGNTAEDGMDGISDAELLVTMAYTTNDPGPQSGKLQSLLSAYRLFRNSQHENVQGSLVPGDAVQHISWYQDNWLEIAKAIFPVD